LAVQQRLERGPLEGVEAHLVDQQVLGPAAEFVHHFGVPEAGRQAVDPGQGGAVPDQRGALVGSARPVQMPGEHHRDRGPASLGDRDGGIADGGFGALQAHADTGERAVRMAEAVLHVHDEQRPVCHVSPPAQVSRYSR
jgi:hypothetical protein